MSVGTFLKTTKGKIITGHLQYYFFKGKEHFGFKSDWPPEEYDRSPVFHGIETETTFEIDLQNEKNVMSEFMRLYYYNRLRNTDKTNVMDYHRVTDVRSQKEGIDVTCTVNGIRYIIDEKAQMDYIYNSRPLPTFSLELLNATSGNMGWLINPELKTKYYMFIWPHAKKRPLKIENIEYAYFSLVNKEKLLIEIEKRYKMDRRHLLEYAKQMATRTLGDKVIDSRGRCIGYRYKGNEFDEQAYLYYTIKKAERPVNLIVKRAWLDDLSEHHGMIKK